MIFPNRTLSEDPAAPTTSSFYDRAFSKWLPVPRSSVAPDGKTYAYSEIRGNAYQNSGSRLHIVDVASGGDRVIYDGSAAFTVVDFATEGVYLTGAVPEGRPRGLWLENLAGGSPTAISTTTIIGPAVGGGAAWGVDFNSADPSPGPGGLEGPTNEILRFDLHTGAATPWFHWFGADVYILGFDRDGSPFVKVGFVDSYEVWRVPSAAHATRLYSHSDLQAPDLLAAVDSHGVWFDAPYASGSSSTVWLYTGGSIQLVTTISVGDLAIVGGCIP